MKPMNFPGNRNRRRGDALMAANKRMVQYRVGSHLWEAASIEARNLEKKVVSDDVAVAVRTKKRREGRRGV